MKPIPHLRARDDRSRLADENQEGCLKRVFGIRLIPQDALAYAEHHRSMAADQQLKCPLVAVRDESFQQFGISGLGSFMLARNAAEVADDTQ
jgi:hypothetical protein